MCIVRKKDKKRKCVCREIVSVCREIEMCVCVERKREFMHIYRECVCVCVSVERINDRESVWRDRDCEDI